MTLDPDAAFEKLRLSYVERLARSAEALTACLDRSEKTGLAVEREEVIRLAHGLAGSAKLFGFAEITRIGRAVDVLLKDGSGAAREAESRALITQLRDLCAAAAEEAAKEA